MNSLKVVSVKFSTLKSSVVRLSLRLCVFSILDYAQRMSSLVITLDDNLVSHLAAMAARNHKPLPVWAAEQLSHLATSADTDSAGAYSAEWLTAFGSISDATFAPPSRRMSRSVAPLDA